jgi:hypothetical protein
MEHDSSDVEEPLAERAGRLLYAAQAQADRLRAQTEQEVAAEKAAAAGLLA